MKFKKILSIIMAFIMLFSITTTFAENANELTGYDSMTCTELGSDELELIHNIAKEYKDMDYSVNDGNLPWIIADMITYEGLFPDSENVLSEEQKIAAAKTIGSELCNAERPGDLAKYILALRALGYDGKNIYTDDLEYIDAVKKLTDLIDLEDEAVKNEYTISYVLIALLQDESFADQEQLDWLIQSIIETKDAWQSTDFGTDALTPMLLALAPYYDLNDEIKELCNEAVEVLKAEQREDGLIDGYPGFEPASTALAICALSSLGIDSYEIKNGGKNLLEGLLSVATPDLDAFPDAFATEQGFRALLSLLLIQENDGKIIYDFRDHPINGLNISSVQYCPVIFDVTPKDAEIIVEGTEKTTDKYYDLSKGTYKYSVSALGYEKDAGEIIIEAEDAENHTLKTVSVSLSKSYSGGGRVPRPSKEKDEKEEQPKENDEKIEDNQNEKEEFNEDTFGDVSADDWYYQAVKYAYENGIFNGTDKGFEPELPMTRAMLVTVLYRLDSSDKTSDVSAFSDIPEDAWFAESVSWASKNNLINGVAENIFAPHSNTTREQFAVLLYRYALLKGYDVELKDVKIPEFADKDKISAYAVDAIDYAVMTGILKGRSESILSPGGKITRAEVATMLMRFSKLKK